MRVQCFYLLLQQDETNIRIEAERVLFFNLNSIISLKKL